MRLTDQTILEARIREHCLGKAALVVDDDSLCRDVVAYVLKAVGFECDTANDGLEALELATQRKYSLIITDIQMPNMDGFELCAALRELESHASTPIFAASSDASIDVLEVLVTRPFNEFFSKPIDWPLFYLAILHAMDRASLSEILCASIKNTLSLISTPTDS